MPNSKPVTTLKNIVSARVNEWQNVFMDEAKSRAEPSPKIH